MRIHTLFVTATAAATLTAGALLLSPATAAGPAERGPEYSFVPGPGPKAHRPVIKVTLKRLPKQASAQVTIKRRTNTYDRPRKTDNRLRRSAELQAGVKHVFNYCRKGGHYYVVGEPVKVKGTVYKAHRARIIVNREHGVHVKLRYYRKGHKHYPVPGVNAHEPGGTATPLPSPSATKPATTQPGKPGSGPSSPPSAPAASPSAAPSQPAPPPAIAYPDTSRGSASSFDRGQGAWRQCTISWSFDPGPTQQLGANVDTELQLLRGIFNSIQKLANYKFQEVTSGAQIQIAVVNHVAAVNGIVPSGVTIPVPQDGKPFTSATIKFDGASLLSPASLGRQQVRQNLYAHEIGHSLGLNHINDPAQIMNPVVPNEHGWGAGDVAALRAMPSTC